MAKKMFIKVGLDFTRNDSSDGIAFYKKNPPYFQFLNSKIYLLKSTICNIRESLQSL